MMKQTASFSEVSIGLHVQLWKILFSQGWWQNIYPLGNTYASSQMLFSVPLSHLDVQYIQQQGSGQTERNFDPFSSHHSEYNIFHI